MNVLQRETQSVNAEENCSTSNLMALINNRDVFKIQDEVSCAKTKCLAHKIPECSQELSGLTIEQPVHLSEDEESSKDYMYVTGYLDHYTPTA